MTTLEGDDAGKSVRTIANEELAAQLIPENAKESLDTLAEIAAWIQGHPDDAAAMNAAIVKLQAIVAGIGGEGEKATVVAYVTDAIAALSIGDYAKAADLTALAARVTTAEGKLGHPDWGRHRGWLRRQGAEGCQGVHRREGHRHGWPYGRRGGQGP